jgi:hypothetical protein
MSDWWFGLVSVAQAFSPNVCHDSAEQKCIRLPNEKEITCLADALFRISNFRNRSFEEYCLLGYDALGRPHTGMRQDM